MQQTVLLASRLPAIQRFNAPQPARRDAGRVVDFGSPRQIDIGGAGALHKIMRRQADLPLRLAHTQSRPHRPRQPRTGLRHGRPDGFVQPAQNHDVGLHQPRLQWAPYGEPFMRWALRPKALAAEPHIKQGRPIGGRNGARQLGLCRQFFHQRGQRPALFIIVPNCRAGGAEFFGRCQKGGAVMAHIGPIRNL